jgi:DNA repair exonuclease SbcCD ATPase subunit
MPRMRPLRTKEEIAAVPQDESVTISLEPEGTVILDKEADDAAIQAEEAKKPLKTQAPPEEDDATQDLKQQLADLRKANEEYQARLNQEAQARQAAEQRSNQWGYEAHQHKIRAEDAEYDAILNAIGAAESEAQAAQRDIAAATEAADAKTVAEASRRLARAEGRLSQLEDGKIAIERAKTEAAARAKNAPVQQPRQQQPTVEQYIDALPNLLPSQRAWLKEHPDSLTDNKKNIRLQNAHIEAEDQGLQPGTNKYFQFMEERLGYRKATTQEEEDDVDDANDRRVAAQVSAPPSRSATSPSTGRQSSTRITLTPEQREAARNSGVDEITYAKNLQKMQDMKAQGLIN